MISIFSIGVDILEVVVPKAPSPPLTLEVTSLPRPVQSRLQTRGAPRVNWVRTSKIRKEDEEGPSSCGLTPSPTCPERVLLGGHMPGRQFRVQGRRPDKDRAEAENPRFRPAFPRDPCPRPSPRQGRCRHSNCPIRGTGACSTIFGGSKSGARSAVQSGCVPRKTAQSESPWGGITWRTVQSECGESQFYPIRARGPEHCPIRAGGRARSQPM